MLHLSGKNMKVLLEAALVVGSVKEKKFTTLDSTTDMMLSRQGFGPTTPYVSWALPDLIPK